MRGWKYQDRDETEDVDWMKIWFTVKVYSKPNCRKKEPAGLSLLLFAVLK